MEKVAKTKLLRIKTKRILMKLLQKKNQLKVQINPLTMEKLAKTKLLRMKMKKILMKLLQSVKNIKKKKIWNLRKNMILHSENQLR